MKQSFKNTTPTVLIFVLIVCCLALVTLFVLRTSRSSSASVYYSFQKVDSVGGDGGEIPAISKLNELVQEHDSDRDYYEVNSIETGSWHQWYANYNKKHHALLISGDPMSGWSYFFYVTPAELKMISDQKIPAYKLHSFLKPFPQHLLDECPTRSRDLF